MQATYIGETNDQLKSGEVVQVTVAKFTGRRYKPGKDQSGWLDKEGELDNRFMVYGGVPYKVYETASDVLKNFRPANDNDVSAVLLKRFTMVKEVPIG
jgi:hypothetical protein